MHEYSVRTQVPTVKRYSTVLTRFYLVREEPRFGPMYHVALLSSSAVPSLALSIFKLCEPNALIIRSNHRFTRRKAKRAHTPLQCLSQTVLFV